MRAYLSRSLLGNVPDTREVVVIPLSKSLQGPSAKKAEKNISSTGMWAAFVPLSLAAL